MKTAGARRFRCDYDLITDFTGRVTSKTEVMPTTDSEADVSQKSASRRSSVDLAKPVSGHRASSVIKLSTP